MEGQEEPVTEPVDPSHPQNSDFLKYALDLFNYEYYWESHVYLESLWNAHRRQGSVADFLKGMIKLAAAALKSKLDQSPSALDHYLRAKELFLLVEVSEGPVFMGFDLKGIIKLIDLALANTHYRIVIHPAWK